jgi:putative MATE family efflux protein
VTDRDRPQAAPGPVTASASAPASAPAAPSRFDRSIVEGPIGGAVWKLAWPTVLQNVIGGLQGILDHVMVGHFVGYTGNAAIGVAWQIFLVVVVFIVSLFTGMGILVARFAGQGDGDKVNRTVYQAFITAGALSLFVLAPIGYVLSPGLLTLVKAAPAVQAEALPYLRIMFVFSFGMMTFFMLGGALRSAGDPRTPLRLGVAMSVLNILLNFVFIAGLGPVPAMGTAGAAVGTCLAGFIVMAWALWRMFGDCWVVQFHRAMDWRPDPAIIRELFRFGLPTGLQGIAMNVGGVMLLRFVGSLPDSAAAQAAYAIGYTQVFSFITWTAMGLMGAAAVITGQNLGAGRPDRADRGVHLAAVMGVASAAGIGLLFLLVPRLLLAAFGATEPAVTELGVELLRYLAVSGLFIAAALVYTGGLQGAGDTKSPLHISIVSQVVVPLGICAIVEALRGLTPADVWLAIVAGHLTRCVLSAIRFRQGRWREIRVEIDAAPTEGQGRAGSQGSTRVPAR